MAKPPAKLPPPKGKPGKSKARTRGRQGAGLMNLLLVFILVVLAIFAFPTFLFVCFGMLPSFVAYVIDRSPRWSLTFSVAPPNLAATAIFIARLWTGHDNTTSAVLGMMFDPYIWCVLYLAAAAGWGVYYGMPVIVTAFKEYSIDHERVAHAEKAKSLRGDWGDDIGPNDIGDGASVSPISAEAGSKTKKTAGGAAPARPV